MGSLYFFLKTLHLLFVIGWLSCVFVLPRLVLLLQDVRWAGVDSIEMRAAIKLADSVYRFGWCMVVALIACGVVMASQQRADLAWLQIKLVLVCMLILYYFVTGILVRRAKFGLSLPSRCKIRVFNESSLFLVVPTLYLAVSKYRFTV